MNNDVFISYSHVNSVVADAICHRFEESGVRCWYAPRNIQPGDEWAEAIIKAIKSSRLLVLIFSDESNDSTQVRREIGAAVNAGIPIVPFKITDAVPTGSMEYYLNTLHWLDAVDQPLEDAIDRLFVMCKAILDTDKEAQTGAAEPDEGSTVSATVADKPERVADRAPQQASSESSADEGSSKRGSFIAIAVIAVLAVCIIAAVASGVFSGDDSSSSSTGGTQQSAASTTSASATSTTSSNDSDSSSSKTITTTTDGGEPNTEEIDWKTVEAHHELPYVVADDDSFIVILGGYHMVGDEPISEFLFYNKSATTVLVDATVNVVANGVDVSEYTISKIGMKSGEYYSLSGFYKDVDENGKKVPAVTGELKSMQSEVVITPWRMEDVILADYPVKWEADETTGANARILDQMVIDDKNFCAMKVTDVSEQHGGYVLMHYSFTNRSDNTEKISFGDDWLVNGQHAIVIGGSDSHSKGQTNHNSLLLYVPEGDRDAAVTSISGTVNVDDRYSNALVSQPIELTFDM